MRHSRQSSGNPAIRQGGIYRLHLCPPLDDVKPKTRPVVVVEDAASLKKAGPNVMVVACSTTIRPSDLDHDLVRMPTEADTPNCRTGLTSECWAVPRWGLVVRREHLSDYLGHIGGQKLIQIIRAVHARFDA